MFNFFKKKESQTTDEFILTQEIQGKINFILIKFNSTFYRELYDKEKYQIPENDYNLFFEIRSSGEELLEVLNKLLKLGEKYPNWAYLLYEIGYTYGMLGDFPQAKQYYEKLLQEEKRGFFNAITENFILEKILTKELDEQVFVKYIRLFDTPIGAVLEKQSEQMIQEYPTFSPIGILYILSLLINRKIENLDEIISRFRLLDADPDTKEKFKALEYIYKLLKSHKDKSILSGIYAHNTSMGIDNLADFLFFDLK